MLIRPRRPDDVESVAVLGFEVHRTDGYPVYVPERPGEFLVSPDALASWVAEIDGVLVGHAALHRSSAPEVMAVAREETGLRDDELAVVARLLVSPDARRLGVGRALFSAIWWAARDLGLRAILDVVVENARRLSSTGAQAGRRSARSLGTFPTDRL